MEAHLWEWLAKGLEREGCVALLWVVASQGSSPGRRGFKMAVTRDGAMKGSIGGGIMEHKLVELALARLAQGEPPWELRRQVHSKEAPRDQSGMICSGEQTILMAYLGQEHAATVAEIASRLRQRIPVLVAVGHQETLEILDETPATTEGWQMPATLAWRYLELLGTRPRAHVIGAGHVGLEMCKVLSLLDFEVVNYDDRAGLNTMEANVWAHQKHVLPYTHLGERISGGTNEYVVVMTFGYRGDDEAVRALIHKRFAYFAMMGSEAKVARLLTDLRKDGFPEEAIAQLRTPAGLVLHCKTPMEIAISIAAEIIAVRNGESTKA